MNNITNNYNTYIKLPTNIGIIHVCINIFKDNQRIKTYDTSDLKEKDRYQLLLFNGNKWKKMPLNGIDSSEYVVIAVNYDFKKDQIYTIDYQFKTLQNEIISIEDYQPVIVNKSSAKKIEQLKQKITIIQIIQVLYDFENQKYQNIMLHWKHSWDYDKDLIFYQLQVEQLKSSVTQRINQFGNIEYDQFQQYEQFLNLTNIPKDQHQTTQKLYYDETFFAQNTVYRYRVRALDEYGQYSNWSEYYYFKKVKGLYGQILVCRKYISSIFGYINIFPPTKDIEFSVSVKQRPMSEFYSVVKVLPLKNIQLNFNVLVIPKVQRLTLYSNINSVVNVTDDKYKLGMNIIISKHYYSSVFGSVQVKSDANILISKIQVVPTLRGFVDVKGNYYSEQLNQKVQVFYSFEPLIQEITLKKWILTTQPLMGLLRIGRQFQVPLQITIYDSNNRIVNVDNRIKIYDEDGNRIYTYNQNSQFINVYPYVQGGSNIPLDIYTYEGDLIQNYYDEDGNVLPCVYTDKNIVKNWIETGNYKLQYNYYDNYTSYIYNYAKQSNISVIYPTSQQFVNINFDSSGQWTFVIRALKNNNNIHFNDTFETIYINKPPKSIELPFYINGLYWGINDFYTINNANPTFAFNGIENDDNDYLRYVIQISKDYFFNDIVVEKYLQYSTGQIIYTLQDQLLKDEGVYYFRILTIDYNGSQEKQVAISPIVQFNYQHYVLSLYGRINRIKTIWQQLGIIATIRGHSSVSQKATLYTTYEQDVEFQLTLYKQRTEIDQLQQSLVIRTVNEQNDIKNKILITHNYSVIDSNIVVYYDYYNFPITQSYIDEYGNSHIVTIREIPECHYLKQKCMVYQGSTQNLPDQEPYTIYFENLKVLRRYTSSIQDQPIYSIIVMNRLNSSQMKMKCKIWNDYYLPYETDSLKQAIPISNRVFGLRWLYGKLTLNYPQPPQVVVASNIPERIWQTNYNAVFNFTLKQKSEFPFKWYVYVVDDKPNTIPTQQNGLISYGTAQCDLRQVGKKITGIKYLHVRSINIKNIYSSNTTVYCIYYNNKVDKPTPLSVNGLTVVGNQMPILQYTLPMLFYWSMVIDEIDVVDSITYDLQIATDVNFINVQLYQKNISGNFFNLLPKTLPPNKYFWRVRAFDQNEYSNWSVTASIYVNKAPQSPTRLSVKNYS